MSKVFRPRLYQEKIIDFILSHARGFHLFCKSHGMREGIAEYEYGRNGRINLHMMIHF